MFEGYQREAEFMHEALAQAADICRRIQAEQVVPELEKQDRSPVTMADYASQAWIAGRLAQEFPADPVVAEEDSLALRQPENRQLLEGVVDYLSAADGSIDADRACQWIDHGNGQPADRYWTLDPIDGTAGFLRGDQWVVALALIESGQVVAGGLACPRLSPTLEPTDSGQGSLVLALQGQGSWVTPEGTADFRQLRVSQREKVSQARLMGSVEPGHTDVEMLGRIKERLGSDTELIRMDSQAKFAMVAGGKADIILRLLSPDRPNYQEKIWDQAAGSLVVQEAGGRVSDLKGRPLDFSTGQRLVNNQGVLVSNGRLHQAALEIIQQVGADSER